MYKISWYSIKIGFINKIIGFNEKYSQNKIPENHRKWQSAQNQLNRITIVTLDSGIDVGQGINVGSGKFGKKNKRRALNKYLHIAQKSTFPLQ